MVVIVNGKLFSGLGRVRRRDRQFLSNGHSLDGHLVSGGCQGHTVAENV